MKKENCKEKLTSEQQLDVASSKIDLNPIDCKEDNMEVLSYELAKIEQEISLLEKEKSTYEFFNERDELYIKSLKYIDGYLQDLDSFQEKINRLIEDIDKDENSNINKSRSIEMLINRCKNIGYRLAEDEIKNEKSICKKNLDYLNGYIAEIKLNEKTKGIQDKLNEKYLNKEKTTIKLDALRRKLCLKVTQKLSKRLIRNCLVKIGVNLFLIIIDVWLIICSIDSQITNPLFINGHRWNIFNIIQSENDYTNNFDFVCVALITALLVLLIIFVNNIVNRYSVAIIQTIVNRNEVESYILTASEVKPDTVNNKIHIGSLEINNRLNRSMISSLLGLED